MALDEAILAAHAQARVPPTVRVYAWKSPTLSLGYAQGKHPASSPRGDLAPLLERCRRAGVGVVRRPTGGRAILHHLEVTYSVTVSASLLGPDSTIARSYRLLCAAIIAALRTLGLEVEFSGRERDPSEPAGAGTAMCFALGAGSDVVIRGAKVVGSAQLRRDGVVLQHGSIPLRYDEALQAAVFGRIFHRSLLSGRITCLEEEAGCHLDHPQTAQALKRGFVSVFGCQPQETPPTDFELDLAALLATKKYPLLT